MTLFNENDHLHLLNDPTVFVNGPDGRQVPVMPYRLGMPPPPMRRDAQGVLRPYIPGMPLPPHIPANHPLALAAANGATPVAMQQQLKKMQPPSATPQMRISSNGGMRPPGIPVTNLQANGSVGHHVSPPHPVPVPIPQHSPPNGVNGVSRAAITMPHVEVPDRKSTRLNSSHSGESRMPSSA